MDPDLSCYKMVTLISELFFNLALNKLKSSNMCGCAKIYSIKVYCVSKCLIWHFLYIEILKFVERSLFMYY